MKNWLKNNKYKIIILPAVLLVGIFVGGCTNGVLCCSSFNNIYHCLDK